MLLETSAGIDGEAQVNTVEHAAGFVAVCDSACAGITYTTNRMSGNVIAIKYSSVNFFMRLI